MQELLQAFISYKRENQSFAENLYEAVADWGFLPWLDVKKLDAGYQPELRSGGWSQQITQAINGSKFMIALITPLSLKSEVVQDEWFAAKQTKKPIFFLRLEPFDMDDMDILYRRYQYIDLVENRAEGLNRLEIVLKNFLEGRHDFREEVTDTSRQNRSLNQDILSDLEQLAKEAPVSPKKDKLIGSANPSRDDEAVLRDRIRRYWLESVLKPSLQEAAAFNIALSLQADAVIEHEGLGNFELGGSIDIYNTYKALKSFLIMGEAGAGKTVMLLQLATKLLRHEKSDIPLVLNLSSWGNEAISLEEWLVKEAERTYQIHATSFKRWLADKKLILLLDGLDEIKEEVRAERIRRINSYREKYNVRDENGKIVEYKGIPMVICSRFAEYWLTTEDKAEKKLDFPHALRLEALSIEQIHAYLAQSGFEVLNQLYHQDVIVRQLAKVPFLLTTMAYTYKGEHIRQLEIKEGNNQFARQKHLFDKYITKQLKSHTPLKYSEEKVKEYLERIAVNASAYGTILPINIFTFNEIIPNSRLNMLIGVPLICSIVTICNAPFNFDAPMIYFVRLFLVILVVVVLSYTIVGLYQAIKLPFLRGTFLQDMYERQILRPLGGSYLFRHDYLRQSFLGKSQIVEEQINFLIQTFSFERLIEALSRFGEPVDILIAALKNENISIRRRAAYFLGELGDKQAVEPLVEAFKDKEKNSNAAFALGKLGDSRAVEPLIVFLEDKNKLVRRDAASGLYMLFEHGERDSRAVEPLIAALKDDDVEVRGFAVSALGKLGDSRAVKPIIAALKDKRNDRRFRMEVDMALLTIGTDEALLALQALDTE